MSAPFFLAEDLPVPLPSPGQHVTLTGAEARHAVTVRRLRIGERVVLTDGRGRGIAGPVTLADRDRLEVEVADQVLLTEPSVRFVVAQALAKGDRSELAVEMLTEVGAVEVLPWQAARSVVRWPADRVDKGRGRWQAAAREATKQSRRLLVPHVAEPVGTKALAGRIEAADLALVLHEGAEDRIADVTLPHEGTVLLVVGPEGGIDDNELRLLTEAGARPVLLGDGVLRTSTAGVVACAALMLR